MNNELFVIGLIVAVVPLIASAIAIYVSLTAKGVVLQFKVDMADFQIKFLKKLDERYVRSSERNKDLVATGREEDMYRVGTREKIDSLQVAVEREKDSLLITLKDIMQLLKQEREK